MDFRTITEDAKEDFRYYHAFQYDRFQKIESKREGFSNLITTLSVGILTFGFTSNETNKELLSLILPILIFFLNLLAILFASMSRQFIKMHQGRADLASEKYFPIFTEFDSKLTKKNSDNDLFNRNRLYQYLHLCFILIAIFIFLNNYLMIDIKQSVVIIVAIMLLIIFFQLTGMKKKNHEFDDRKSIISQLIFANQSLVILLVVVFVTVISFAFLWKEMDDISWNSKINHEKITSYFTVVGFLVSSLTLLYLIKQVKAGQEQIYAVNQQLKEMELQNSFLIQADLVPADLVFKIKKDMTISIDGMPYSAPMPFGKTSGSGIDERAYITIRNDGKGKASSIKCTWQYEIDLFHEILHKHFTQLEKPVSGEQLEYVLRAQQTEYIKTPNHYLALMYLLEKYIVPNSTDDTNFPMNLILKLDYVDEFNRVRQQSFETNCDWKDHIFSLKFKELYQN